MIAADQSIYRSDNGEYAYRLGGNLRVERVKFSLLQINTLTPAQLLARSNDKQPWHRVSNTVLYRLAANGSESLSPDIVLDGMPVSELLLKLDMRAGGIGGAAPPMKVALSPPQQLVFLARGNGPYTLAWGNRAAKPASLPLTTLVPGYQSQASLPGDEASLEKVLINPVESHVAQTTANTIDPALKRKWTLWGLLITGAALLLIMSWGLLRSNAEKKP